jgi:tetratricopeptide (TPR) repeat protein
LTSCFISYTGVDEPWGKWLAAVLREAGHHVTLQATDFRPGENFVIRMQEAASSADHTLVVFSNRYLASGFGASEWAAAFAADPMGVSRKLIPIAIEPVDVSGLWRAIVRLEIFDKSEDAARNAVLNAVTPQSNELSAPFPTTLPASDPLGPNQSGKKRTSPQAVEVWCLPTSASTLIGREEELGTLRDCWLTTSKNLVTVVGWGGCGKTALLNHWIAEMAAAQYKGADRVFAWSFDSQAEGGQVATSDQFIDAALRFFGAEGSQSASVWERCRQVTTLFQQTRSLLVLDGLDRLQEPPGRAGGTLREPALRMLVRELAAFNHGLCVITSRLSLTDVQQFLGHTCVNIPIGVLSTAESSALLTKIGLHGDPALLVEIAMEAGCHPLTLSLLGSFIRTVYHSDLNRWKGSALAGALESTGDDTAGRVMDEYASWFADRPESQILSVVGLFDRPASDEEFKAIRARPVVAGLNDLLVNLNDIQWAYAISNLITSGLLTVRSEDEKSVDAHPLVRSHFGNRLQRNSPEGCMEGHRRLCEYLASAAVSKPSRLEECLPLLSAVWHGTQAGLAAEMLSQVYWARLAQDNHLLRDVLGASASNFEVLSYVVAADDRGDSPVPKVELARILCDQAIDLRILGRPMDAISPLQRAADLARRASEDRLATNALRHLAQLYLTIGNLEDARRTALSAVECSLALEPLNLDAISARMTLAHIEEHIGNDDAVSDAMADLLSALMNDALAYQYSYRATLYIQAYRFVEISLRLMPGVDASAGSASVHGGTSIEDLSRLVHHMRVLNEGSGNSALPRALMRLASSLIAIAVRDLNSRSAGDIDLAVSEIRQSGQRPWLVQGLLVRTRLLRCMGALDSAANSLSEARALCLVDGMVTGLCDCDYEAAMIAIADGNTWQGQIMLESLSRVAATHGYWRLCAAIARHAVTQPAARQEPSPRDGIHADTDA